MNNRMETYKPLDERELIDLHRLVDEISLAAVTEHEIGRLFATVQERDEKLATLRTIVDGLNDQMRTVVAHYIQESRIKGLENEVFALKDGIRGNIALADKAEKRAKRYEEFEQIIDDVSRVVDEFDETIEGTLAERVRKALEEKHK